MKKIFYSNITKLTAFILCVIFTASCAYLAATSFTDVGGSIYFMEDSYEESYMARRTLEILTSQFSQIIYMAKDIKQNPETEITDNSVISETAEETADTAEKIPEPTPKPLSDEEVDKKIDEYIKSNLARIERYNGEYYLNFNGKEYSNTSDKSYEAFRDSPVSAGVVSTYNHLDYYFHPVIYGGRNEPFGVAYSNDPVTACVRLSAEGIAANKEAWNEMKSQADKAIPVIVILLILIIVLAAYLFTAAGRRADDREIHLMLVDRLFTEISLALFAGALIAMVMFDLLIVDEFIIWEQLKVGYKLVFAVTLGLTAIALAFALSMARNMKAREFLKHSLIYRVCVWVISIIKKIWRRLVKFAKRAARKTWSNYADFKRYIGRRKSNVIIASLFAVYSVALAIFSLLMGLIREEGAIVAFAFMMVLVIAASVYLRNRLIGFEKIREGVEKIRGGDTDHKIEGCPDGALSCMADDINGIGDGMREAVEKGIKSERMKSELITNVSHDLKTPLTSIISYADLLCAENLTPPEANDYAKIIRKKGERLKNLTADLFDISKVQSGNEIIAREKLDVCLLLRQTLGELDSGIKQSGLEFAVSIPEKEIMIEADGKKLSRVFENLLVNCIKYAMKGTRVYVSVRDSAGKAVTEIKNIANYRMNFSADEITERFVRGDESRTDGGSGLGLAIAKSYTEACGGSFEVTVDGDLFKVGIGFDIL